MSTHGQFNTKSPTIKRILREAAELSSSSSPDYTAAPLDANLFEWHFTLRGPPAPSPFASGIYHGRIVLPPSYPLRPPSFRFLTPSGRFEPNREICLSISGHHEESWQPAWGIRTALVAIRSFMDTEVKGQVGGVEASAEVRRRFAEDSKRWRCSGGCSAAGRCLEDVMKEREVEVAAMEGEKTEEAKVPEELKLGYRDEMEKAAKDAQVTATEDSREEDTAEGSSIASLDGTLPRLDRRITSDHLPPPPVSEDTTSSSTVSTPTIPLSSSPSSSQPPLQPQRRLNHSTATARNNNTPQLGGATQFAPRPPQRLRQAPATAANWLDYAIVGIAAALGALLIRKWLTFDG